LRNQIKEREYIDMLKRSQVDGIIMGSHILEADDYMGLNLPVISLDRQLSPTIPYICSDNYVGGQIATEHLISKGCKKLLHISGSLEVKMLSNKRTDAFIDTCNKAGIEFLAYELPDSSIAHFHEENILMDILKKHSDCDGIFATSDVTAAALINAACQVGKKVPEDIQIVGFDGSLTALLTTPKITSIKQPMEDIARYAVDYLIKIMNGETVPTTNILPVKLLKQGSTN
jgi:LacI family sucrose operon transcriptional repressor